MNKFAFALLAPLSLALALNPLTASAYGGGSSSASCEEARFYDESPARNSTLQSFEAIKLVASDNTDLATLEVAVNGQPVKPEASQRRSGEWDLTIKPAAAITQAGKVQITLTAKSREGCSTFLPIYLVVKP